jgi:uncharacterized protein
MASYREDSSYSEVMLVLFVALGNPIVASLMMLFDAGITSKYSTLTSDRLLYTCAYEIMVLSLTAFFLKRRGWVREDLYLDINWRLTVTGFVLAGCCILVTYSASYLLPLLGLKAAESVLQTGPHGLDIAAILTVSVVNPFFEETIVVAYLMGAFLNPEAPTKAINISVGVRLLYHLYQGAAGVITIVPMGLLFSYYFYKKRKLWPLVLAHGIMDLVALGTRGQDKNINLSGQGGQNLII